MPEPTYNTKNTTNLGQLKRAMLRSHNEVTDLAAIVYGAIEDMILQSDITVPTSAWTANDDAETLALGYQYKAGVLVPKLIENANVNVTLSASSLAIAAKARMCKTASIAEDAEASEAAGTKVGKITFYAKKVPTANLAGKLDAIQLDDSEEESEEI